MFEPIYTKEEREKKIKIEKARLIKVFSKEENIASLIDEAAFLRINLEETRAIINRDGIIDTYKNGENQFGQKKSASVEVYDKTFNSYLKVMKQLLEYSNANINEDDEFIKFVNKRK